MIVRLTGNTQNHNCCSLLNEVEFWTEQILATANLRPRRYFHPTTRKKTSVLGTPVLKKTRARFTGFRSDIIELVTASSNCNGLCFNSSIS